MKFSEYVKLDNSGCLKAIREICGSGYVAEAACEGLVVIREKCPRQETPQPAHTQLNFTFAPEAPEAPAPAARPKPSAPPPRQTPPPTPPPKSVKRMKKFVRPDYNAGLRLDIGTDNSSETWVSIPAAGAYQGFCIVGAPGTGKTSGAIYPLLHQLIGHPARIGGFLLEVKGNMMQQIRRYAERYNRADDIVVIRPGGGMTYNPLYSDAPAEFLASRLTEATINLAGGMDPREAFWIQSAEDVSRNIIRLKRLTTGYVTMEDIFVLSTDDEGLAREMGVLDSLVESGEVPKEEAAGVCMWYVKWANMEARMKNSIVGEVTRFTNLFVDSLEFRKTFCPKQEDITFAGFDDVINKGQIVVLDMPPQKYGNAASSVATLLKLDYFDTVLRRTMTDEQIVSTYETLTFLSRGEYKLREELSDLKRQRGRQGQGRCDSAKRVAQLEAALDLLEEVQDDKVMMKITKQAKPGVLRRYIYNMERRSSAGGASPGTESEQGRLWDEILSVTQDWLAVRPASAGVAGALNKQRPVFFICDEYQNFVSGGGMGSLKSDNMFYDRSRESRCINLVAFQDYSSLLQKLRPAVAYNILACLQNKFWLKLESPVSSLIAADACRDEDDGAWRFRPAEFMSLKSYQCIFKGSDGAEVIGPMKVTLPRHYELDSLPGRQVS